MAVLEEPTLPQFDPDDVFESAVVARLASNWSKRATVKKAEPDLDELFDLDKHDFPDSLIPFGTHETYTSLDPEAQNRLRAWGWISYNKNVMDVEQHVVHPGFALLAQDAFETRMGDTLAIAVTQAMVDEQYHTLMHLNASAVTRRRRGWDISERALPLSGTVRRQRTAQASAPDSWSGALSALAFTTVAEISITSYLDLIEDDETIQPVNRATVKLHNRDEYCHASIADEMAAIVFEKLNGNDRRLFLDGLIDSMDAFSSSDFSTWSKILELENVAGAEAMIHDVQSAGQNKRLVQDYSGIRSLCRRLGVEGDVEVEWPE